jgi:diguanylate cyclase (GGDEF)-like protein
MGLSGTCLRRVVGQLSQKQTQVVERDSRALIAPAHTPSQGRGRRILANLFIIVVILGAIGATAAALAVAATQTEAAERWSWPLFAVLVAVSVLLDRTRTNLFGASRVSLSFVAVYGTGLLLGPGAAGAAGLAATLSSQVFDRKTWYKAVFNAAAISISGIASALAFYGMAGAPSDSAILSQLPAAILAALVGFLVNSAIVTAIVALTGERRFVPVWKEKFAWLGPHYLAFGVAAYAMVVAYLALGAIGAAIFAMPVVMLWVAVLQYTDRTRETTEELQHANIALGRSEQRYRALVHNAPGVTIVVNADETVQSVSVPIGRRGEPETISDLAHPTDLAALRTALNDTIVRPRLEPTLELKLLSPDGRWRDYETTVTNLLDKPAVTGLVLNARDVTDRKALEDALRHQAYHDPLTNLPNRSMFMERLETALEQGIESGRRTAVMFIDLDRFKIVNDSLGHNVGDELLVALAERLLATTPETSLVSRFGGDEFTLLVPEVESQETVTELARELLAALRGPVKLLGHNTIVTASIGVSMSGERVRQPRDLIRSADIALSHAKEQGRSRYVLFDETLDKYSVDRLRLESELRQAVEQDQLRLHYQPEIDLQSGEVVGFEALVRWMHPSLGLIPPAEFITLAEETGEMLSIGNWVLREACRQAAEWTSTVMAGRPFTMAVNVSANEFLEPGLAWEVLRVLRETGLDPGVLRIEITESVLLDDSAVATEILLELKRIGVELAIDDFGTGYSSLSYLRRLPADILKIDRSFVADVDQDEREAAIVEAVVRVADALGMRIVAEGIERIEQAHFLANMGCQSGQGYHFARPAEAEATELAIADRRFMEPIAS